MLNTSYLLSFMQMLKSGLQEFLDTGKLNNHNLEPASIEVYKEEIAKILLMDLEEFKAYTLLTERLGQWSIEYEVMMFILHDVKFNYNRSYPEKIFNLTKQVLLSENYLQGQSIFDVLLIQYLLIDFEGSDFEKDIFELVNLSLDQCKKQPIGAEAYIQFYNLKQSLVLSSGNKVDCSGFGHLSRTGHQYYMQPDNYQEFYNFVATNYPGIEHFVVEL
jgi:hypothetical protein